MKAKTAHRPPFKFFNRVQSTRFEKQSRKTGRRIFKAA
jgi:hypothetical protein